MLSGHSPMDRPPDYYGPPTITVKTVSIELALEWLGVSNFGQEVCYNWAPASGLVS